MPRGLNTVQGAVVFFFFTHPVKSYWHPQAISAFQKVYRVHLEREIGGLCERLSWVGLILPRTDPTGAIKRELFHTKYTKFIFLLHCIPLDCTGAQHNC